MKVGWENREENGIYFVIDEISDAPIIYEGIKIFYVLQGRVQVFKWNEQYTLNVEDMLVLNPYERHEIYCESGNHVVSIHIEPERVIEAKIGWICLVSSREKNKDVYLELLRKKLGLICRHILNGKKQELYIKSELLGILAILGSEFLEERENGADSDTIQKERGTRPDVLTDIIQFLYQHYMDDCSLQSVASHFYISPSYLSRLFVEKTGNNYSDYLDKIRLMHAEAMLITSEKSVTEIASSCGYGNVNTFIVHFREKHRITPVAYRKKNSGVKPYYSDKSVTQEYYDGQLSTRLFALLKYATREENHIMDSVASQNSISASVDLGKRKSIAQWNKAEVALHMGYASGYFSPYFEQTARMMAERIPYQFLFLIGIFDDTIDVCRTRNDGTLEFRYAILDRITDFVYSLGLRPWYELSRTPAALLKSPEKAYDGGFVQLPADLNEWSEMIYSMFTHFINRYGEREVSQWRLSISPSFLTYYGVFTTEQYRDYYKVTFKTIRRILPTVTVTSGAYDVGLLRLSGGEEESDLTTFLMEMKTEDMLPDEIALQSFQVNYQKEKMSDTLEKIRRATHMEGEPAPPSANPDQMIKDIHYVQKCLQRADVNMDISVINCSSSIWHSDLGCDTCYKSAFFIKNYLESAGKLRFLNHNVFHAVEADGSLFSGGPGAVTAYGIPKAIANTMMLIPLIGQECYACGPGWFVTGNQDKSEIQVIMYHYEHYNLDLHLDVVLPREEQMKIDRYIGFENHGAKDVRITLQGVKPGKWKREDFCIDREYGSSYDIWYRTGTPKRLTPNMIQRLVHISEPGLYYEEVHVWADRSLQISSILEPLSVRLIQLKRDEI